jgi:hypothetical protein
MNTSPLDQSWGESAEARATLRYAHAAANTEERTPAAGIVQRWLQRIRGWRELNELFEVGFSSRRQP